MKTNINQNQINSTVDIFTNKGRFIKFMCSVLKFLDNFFTVGSKIYKKLA